MAYRLFIVIDEQTRLPYIPGMELPGGAVLTHTEQMVAGAVEYSFALDVKSPCAMETLDFEFAFEPAYTDACRFFNHGFCTNDFVGITTLEQTAVSRDIVMYREENRGFSLAMTSADTFLTRFISTRSTCVLRYYLESKTLETRSYPLEQFLLSDTLWGGDFFEVYTTFLQEKHHIHLPKVLHTGWSSWSCLYDDVTAAAVLWPSRRISLSSPSVPRYG